MRAEVAAPNGEAPTAILPDAQRGEVDQAEGALGLGDAGIGVAGGDRLPEAGGEWVRPGIVG
jgi:hypothetical protein